MSGAAGASGPGTPGPAGDDLLQAFQQPGCPVCDITRASVRAYLESISYESVTDPGVRLELIDSLGYCAVHGQEWLSLQNTLGTALIYRDVCGHIGRVLADPAATGGLRGRLQQLAGGLGRGSAAGRALAAALAPRAPCPACRQSRQLERQTVLACAAALAGPAVFEAFRAHPVGLCLPHFRAVVAQIGDGGLLQRLVAAHAAHFAATHADLAEVARKYDYRFTSEPHGAEFAGPPRSVVQVAGTLPTLLNLPADSD